MTTSCATLPLEHYLKQLKLPTMLREYASVAAVCAREDQDHTAFLLRLVERELIEREQRAAQRRIKAAKFPVLKTLDTFQCEAQPSINRPLILELMGGEYLENQGNILLMGNPGTGKTHLATALGQAACRQGKRVRFFSLTALVTQLLESREDRQLERFLKRLEKQHLLILDEFGYVPFSKAGAELLFEVVSRAYERTSLILTTNLPFEHWTEVLGNERLTSALLDQITHRVHIIEANGESYRLRDAKKRARNQRRKQPSKSRPSPRGGVQGQETQSHLYEYGESKIISTNGASLLHRHPLQFFAAIYKHLLKEPASSLGLFAHHCEAESRDGTLVLRLALSVARGKPWLGSPTTQGLVLHLALEEKRDEVRRHFRQMGATADDPVEVHVAPAPENALELLRQEVRRKQPALVIIDLLFRGLGAGARLPQIAKICQIGEPSLPGS